jgi:hypothetical protein
MSPTSLLLTYGDRPRRWPLVGAIGDAAADGVGFEPTSPCGLAVFKTAALNHSATHPAAAPLYPILRGAGNASAATPNSPRRRASVWSVRHAANPPRIFRPAESLGRHPTLRCRNRVRRCTLVEFYQCNLHLRPRFVIEVDHMT